MCEKHTQNKVKNQYETKNKNTLVSKKRILKKGGGSPKRINLKNEIHKIKYYT